jgi:phosphatidylglycerophosphatase A
MSGRTLSNGIATCCGIGTVPFAPGTVASVVAAAGWYWWYPSHGLQWVLCLLLIVAGIIATEVFVKHVKQKDPPEVVIDEVAGMWLALSGLPRTLLVVSLGLLVFRLLDISKVPPIKWLERLPGGIGIMGDDLAAGLLTHLVLMAGLGMLGSGLVSR